MESSGGAAFDPVGDDGAGAVPADGRVLRLYRFRPVRVAFDRTMREVILPDLAMRPGVLQVCAARKGPAETGTRVVASLWTSLEAMTEAMGPDLERLRFFPEHFGETTDHQLEVLPVLVAMRHRQALQSGIMRVARGELATLSVRRYADDARAGIEADIRAGHGPASIALAESGERRFVTVSCWYDWDSIEQATGSTAQRPINTMRITDLSSFDVDHLELVPIGG
jgi:hypothetical protein